MLTTMRDDLTTESMAREHDAHEEIHEQADDRRAGHQTGHCDDLFMDKGRRRCVSDPQKVLMLMNSTHNDPLPVACVQRHIRKSHHLPMLPSHRASQNERVGG